MSIIMNVERFLCIKDFLHSSHYEERDENFKVCLLFPVNLFRFKRLLYTAVL